MPPKLSVEEQAFLNGIKENLHKLSALERLGFEPEMSRSRDDVQVITANIIKALTTYFSDFPECKDLIVQLKEAEVAAIKEMDSRVEVPRVFSSEPPMPEAEGWRLRTEPSLLDKSLHRLSSPIWVVLGLLLFVAIYWNMYSPHSLGSKPDNTINTSLSEESGSQVHPQVSPILGRPNPYDSLPKMNTPQQVVNDTLENAWDAGKKAVVAGIEQGGALYYSGHDPSLNLLWQARRGDLEQMKLWVEKGADVNIVDPHKNGELETPLMCAVRSGNPDAVEFLLSRVSDQCKELENRQCSTALTIARSLRNSAHTVEEGRRYLKIEQSLRR